jgi:hypothetical protein
MPWHKMFLAAAMAAVVTATFLPIEASARWRGWGYRDVELGLSGADFCGGRLPAYGTDACGYRKVSYGQPYRPYGPQPRRVWICG